MTAEERRAAREARRAANKAAWAEDARNANARRGEILEAVAPEVAIAPREGSASLAKLRAIMADGDTPIYRRMDCADVIIDYELGAGAGVDVPADQLASSALAFYRAAEGNSKTPEALRFRALKAITRIENSRKAATMTPAAHFANREFARRLINAARREALIQAGTWPQVVASGARWALDASDNFEEPVLPDRLGISIEKVGIAEYLDAANRAPGKEQHAAERSAILLGIRAQNRPDDWDRLLTE